MQHDYDILFVGGGPAGYEGAIAAARRGLKTAVIEMEKVGGTCLQRGCIPTKTILHSVRMLKLMREAGKIGLAADNCRAMPEEIWKRKERVVSKHTRGIENLFKQSGVELIQGRAQMTGSDSVIVNSERTIKAKHIVLATGSVAVDLPFLRHDGIFILNSDDLLAKPEIPESLLVIGAGAVGLEWAVIYAHLGSKVTVVEILGQVLPGSDAEICAILKTELQKQGITIHTATAASAARIENGVTMTLNKEGREWQEKFAKVLLSVGRRPRTSDLDLAKAGIATDAKGFVVVAENLRTAAANVFACGDIAGAPLLAHKAAHQALSIVEFIASGQPVSLTPVPAAVFTFPEVASVGLSEEEAKKKNIHYTVGRFPWAASSRANAIEEKAGLVKVLADEKQRIMGAHLIGPESGELLPLLTYAVAKAMPVKEWREMIFIHPTLSESLWEAVGQIGHFAVHL